MQSDDGYAGCCVCVEKKAAEPNEYTYLRLACIDRFAVIIFDEIYHQSGAPLIEMINGKI